MTIGVSQTTIVDTISRMRTFESKGEEIGETRLRIAKSHFKHLQLLLKLILPCSTNVTISSTLSLPINAFSIGLFTFDLMTSAKPTLKYFFHVCSWPLVLSPFVRAKCHSSPLWTFWGGNTPAKSLKHENIEILNSDIVRIQTILESGLELDFLSKLFKIEIKNDDFDDFGIQTHPYHLTNICIIFEVTFHGKKANN